MPPRKRDRLYLLGHVEHLGPIQDPLTAAREIDEDLVAEGRKSLGSVIRLRANKAAALAAPATIAATVDDDLRAVSNLTSRLRPDS